jgi:outer membrane protein insertion porin family
LAASGVLASSLPAGPAFAQAGLQPPVLASPAPLGAPVTPPRIDVPIEQTAPVSTAPAANQTGVVRRIVVQGNERIESATVLSYLPIEPGETIDPARVDLALKTLFRTDLFSDVRMELSPEGELVVRVVENPILNQVVFEGNKALNDEKLRDEVTVAPRGIFTRSKVQQDVQRILELYRRSGRISATVTPKIVELPQRRVDLIFEISEGPKTGILRINFIGNKAISDNNLREQLVTKESHWYKFFSSNDNYDPDRIEYDREQLRKYYTNRGYYDFRVVSSVAELSPDQKDFAVTFTIDEGPKYRFGKLNVTTDLKRLNSDVLKALLPIREGQLYESDRIEGAVDALTFAAGAAGFAFVDIRPRYTPNRQNNTIDVTFDVREGPRVYVERIDIVGNTRTLDHVIRREIRLAEGDAYNRVLVDRSRTEVRRLGFFKTVDLNQQPGSAADRTVLQVQVQEQPTGELSFGAGYSSYDKLLLDVGISEHNFRGRGQDVRLRASVGSLRQQIDFSFTEPRFRGRDLRFGVDIFSYKYDFSDYTGYRSDSTGGGLRFGFPLNVDTYFGVRYQLSHDNVIVGSGLCDPDSQSISSTICDQLGSQLTSQVGYTITHDKRNDPLRPTGGYFASLDQSFAGLGGDVKYIRTELNGAIYHGFTPSWVLKFEGSAGVIQGWGGSAVRVNNRFFKGGNTFRGFEIAGIGPRDTLYDEALGGKVYAIGTVELSVPIPLPEQYGIRAALFSDFGTLGKLDSRFKRNENVRDDLKLRASAGVSVFWTSPMGPLRLDFSKVLSKAPYDRTETFRFSTQTAF